MNKPVREESSKTLDESDLSIFRDETRDASNPMNMLREFLGLSFLTGGALAATDFVADIAGSGMEIVGNINNGFEGLMTQPGQAIDLGMNPEMQFSANDANYNQDISPPIPNSPGMARMS